MFILAFLSVKALILAAAPPISVAVCFVILPANGKTSPTYPPI